MSQITLLHLSDDPRERQAFAWEHFMAHRSVLGTMSPLIRFSALPYLLDPMQDENQPGSMWHLNHQQAHNDMLVTLPASFIQAPNGLAIDQILRDSDLSNPRQGPWWIFSNHMEHYLAGAAVLPQTETLANTWIYPFW